MNGFNESRTAILMPKGTLASVMRQAGLKGVRR